MAGYGLTPHQGRLLLDGSGAAGPFLLLTASGALLTAGAGFREAQLSHGPPTSTLALFCTLTGAWSLLAGLPSGGLVLRRPSLSVEVSSRGALLRRRDRLRCAVPTPLHWRRIAKSRRRREFSEPFRRL